MEVRHDGFIYRRAASNCVDRFAPDIADLLNIVAGVDDSPTVSILQEPEIDMVERKRQRHTHPMDAGSDSSVSP